MQSPEREHAEFHESVVVDEFRKWRGEHMSCRVSKRREDIYLGDIYRCLDHKVDFEREAESKTATPFDNVASAPIEVVVEAKPARRQPARFSGRKHSWLVDGGQ